MPWPQSVHVAVAGPMRIGGSKIRRGVSPGTAGGGMGGGAGGSGVGGAGGRAGQGVLDHETVSAYFLQGMGWQCSVPAPSPRMESNWYVGCGPPPW